MSNQIQNRKNKISEKFDFGIHYIFDQRTVYVLAVYHTKQNSDNWFH